MSGLGRQAKTLTDAQFRALTHYVADSGFPERNRTIALLSFRAGLRATEIAAVTWKMVSDAEGSIGAAIALTNDASKGKRGGRVVPIHPELKTALVKLQARERLGGRGTPDDFIVHFAKGATDVATRSNSVQFLFRQWFVALGFSGASSHSGRRTFITRCARKVSEVGGSLRDVQALAGHASIATTQRYIDCDPEAQRKLIERL